MMLGWVVFDGASFWGRDSRWTTDPRDARVYHSHAVAMTRACAFAVALVCPCWEWS